LQRGQFRTVDELLTKTKQMSKSKIPYRNRSRHGWWVASYLQRAAWDENPRPAPKSRHLAWENTIIIKARNRNEAYKKALKIGRSASSEFSREGHPESTGRWKFLGLTSLLPIYEGLEDGAEIIWEVHENRSLKTLLARVKKKHELEAFDDST
jgi:hypothetical protein